MKQFLLCIGQGIGYFLIFSGMGSCMALERGHIKIDYKTNRIPIKDGIYQIYNGSISPLSFNSITNVFESEEEK